MDYFLSEFEMAGDIRWIQGVGEDLPFENNYFDIVITTNTLDHTMNPKKVLCEIARVLKENGTLMVSVDVYTPFVQHYRKFRELLGMGDNPHTYAFSIRDVTKLLDQSGLKVLKIHEGIGNFGTYIHRRFSRLQKPTSQAPINLRYYERGVKVLKEKGFLAFSYPYDAF